MIDLDALVSLRAVDDHGTVGAAADALGFTPSAVSQQVKRLERQLGLALLERVGRGVILTGAGRQLVDDGAAVLAELERIEAGLHRAASSVSGHLRLSAFSTSVRDVVAPALGRLTARHPDLSVTLHEGEPWDVVDLVADGRQDLGLVHSWGDVPLPVPDHVVSTHLTRDVADVVLPASHPLAGRRRLSPHDLLDAAWIATPEGTICRQWLTRMYLGTGRLPHVAHVSMEFDSHLALVRAGLGIALVPRLGRAELPAGVVAVAAIDPVPTREVVALHRRTMSDSPAVRALLAELRATAEPPPAAP
ncbi:LysR family transcriptional regulator [Nocardioides mangrovicus]|uniref:LysR family transcriptional regulator n=1 Tax=Nocardioides mangrovicus TaxID=2478913 RepID=A0A3L8NXY7_9ACTN|nr:LysR family transcriptional regulator [Nocardioides mangrovicus]RLV47552.1 LysR family transcriptional regulator [Nocardioides mangrovicus]